MPNADQLTRVSPLLNPEQALVDCDGLKLGARQNTTSIQVLAFKNQHAATAKATDKSVGYRSVYCTGCL